MKKSVLLLALVLSLASLSGCISDDAVAPEAPAPVVATEVSVLETQASTSGDEETLARDFCCVVKMDPPVICHQWHTAAVWAGPKCVAAGVGLNRRGSTLYRGSCGDHPECF
jgi:hypothetical protein